MKDKTAKLVQSILAWWDNNETRIRVEPEFVTLARALQDKPQKILPIESFEEGCILLDKYILDNGRLPSKQTVFKYKQLGQWVQEIKKQMNMKRLTKVQNQRLRQICIKYCISLNTIKQTKKRGLRTFNDWLEILEEYLKEKGTPPGATTHYKGKKIGYWWSKVKCKFRNEELTLEQKEIIEGLLIKYEIDIQYRRGRPCNP